MRSCAERVLTVTSRLNFPITIETTGVHASSTTASSQSIDTIQISAATNVTVTCTICGSEMLTASVIKPRSLEKRDMNSPGRQRSKSASAMRFT
jgi:hypothetical protein